MRKTHNIQNTPRLKGEKLIYLKPKTKASSKMFYNRSMDDLINQSRSLVKALRKINNSLKSPANAKNLSKPKRAVSTPKSNLTGFKNLGKILLVLGGATLLSRGIAEYLDND